MYFFILSLKGISANWCITVLNVPPSVEAEKPTCLWILQKELDRCDGISIHQRWISLITMPAVPSAAYTLNKNYERSSGDLPCFFKPALFYFMENLNLCIFLSITCTKLFFWTFAPIYFGLVQTCPISLLSADDSLCPLHASGIYWAEYGLLSKSFDHFNYEWLDNVIKVFCFSFTPN